MRQSSAIGGVQMSSVSTGERLFLEDEEIFVDRRIPCHRDIEYGQENFDILLRIQREHFWYRGRHKLLLKVLRAVVEQNLDGPAPRSAIDLGGGCGGWLEYLCVNYADEFSELALGDSSFRALSLAGPVVSKFAKRYQVDLLDLPWRERWDVVFLLDVLEHIPDHERVLRQVRDSLRPGGLLLVTTPALNLFWTDNDALVGHQRRYCKRDFTTLARTAGLTLLRSDYFMFLLSPVLILSRVLNRLDKRATPQANTEHLVRTHRVPGPIVNRGLETIFSIEAALIDHLVFPWGTSILAVLQRPQKC